MNLRQCRVELVKGKGTPYRDLRAERGMSLQSTQEFPGFGQGSEGDEAQQLDDTQGPEDVQDSDDESVIVRPGRFKDTVLDSDDEEVEKQEESAEQAPEADWYDYADEDENTPAKFFQKHFLGDKSRYKAPVKRRGPETEEQFVDRVSYERSKGPCERRGHDHPPCMDCRGAAMVLSKQDWDRIKLEEEREKVQARREDMFDKTAGMLADIAGAGITKRQIKRFIAHAQEKHRKGEEVRLDQYMPMPVAPVEMPIPKQTAVYDPTKDLPLSLKGCLQIAGVYRGEEEELGRSSKAISWYDFRHNPKYQHVQFVNVKVGRYWKTFSQGLQLVGFVPGAPHFADPDIIQKLKRYFNDEKLNNELTPKPGDVIPPAKKKTGAVKRSKSAHESGAASGQGEESPPPPPVKKMTEKTIREAAARSASEAFNPQEFGESSKAVQKQKDKAESFRGFQEKEGGRRKGQACSREQHWSSQ